MLHSDGEVDIEYMILHGHSISYDVSKYTRSSPKSC